MKKTYDWAVRLDITVSNSQRKLEVVSSVHANIHKVTIEIAKLLKLPVLDTRIELYGRGTQPLKATSTLLQNDIVDPHVRLTATVTRTKPPGSLPIAKEQSQSKGGKEGREGVESVGLSVVSSCTNPSCVNYNQSVEISYGFGDFPILELTSFAKCEVCPYKSQHLRPNMMCHELRVEHCLYQLKGSQLNSCGIPTSHQTPFLKSQGVKQLQRWLSERPWHMGMQLCVRPL
jgi:hypothetical protein